MYINKLINVCKMYIFCGTLHQSRTPSKMYIRRPLPERRACEMPSHLLINPGLLDRSSQASILRKKLYYKGQDSGATARHTPPQAATGCPWAPQAVTARQAPWPQRPPRDATDATGRHRPPQAATGRHSTLSTLAEESNKPSKSIKNYENL